MYTRDPELAWRQIDRLPGQEDLHLLERAVAGALPAAA